MDITVRKIAAWIFGVLFTIGGLGMATESVGAGLITALVGVFLLPVVRNEISSRFGIQFSSWMVVLIAVVGLGVAGAMMPTATDSTNTEPETTDSQEMNSDQTETSSEPGQEYTHSIGDSFSVGELSYTVTDVITRSVVGTNRYTQEEADGEFVLVDILITNDGQESTSITNDHLKLVDSQERSYTVDTDAFLAVEDSFTFEQLDPGLSKSGTLVYDTPASQTGRTLEVSPAGIFSTAEPHYVNLE